MQTTTRKAADCRKYPSDINCSLYISGREDEVLPVAIWHAVNAHGHADTPEFREEIKGMLETVDD
jgi:hypothetical protein